MYEGYQKKSVRKTSQGIQSGTLGEVLFGAGQEESFQEIIVDAHSTEDREE